MAIITDPTPWLQQLNNLTAERDEKQNRIEYLTERYERMKAERDALTAELERYKAFVAVFDDSTATDTNGPYIPVRHTSSVFSARAAIDAGKDAE
jgi:hypothetical protein